MLGAAMFSYGAGTAETKPLVEEVIVTGYADRQLLLDAESRTGSRLGLTVRETPALIDVLTEAKLQEIGARTSIEALNSAPGVTAANLASGPGTTSIRGFTSGAISLLYNGVRQTNSGMVTRNMDSWSFERIEVLKGPASVLYGEGALAGAINLVPKRPSLTGSTYSGLGSYGSFDSMRVAMDANVPVSQRSAARWVASGSRSDGYIDDTHSRLASTTLSWLWQPTDAVTVDLAGDYYSDDYETAYWGTPLVPASVARRPSAVVRTSNGLVLDASLRDSNFNVDDAVADSKSWWLRSRVQWRMDDVWSLTNEANYYDALRRWRNSETYTFDAATGLMNRGSTRIDHDHQFWSERLVASAESQIAGRRSRFSAGAEYGRNDFENPRRFGTTSALDPYGTGSHGVFPVGDTAANFPGAGNRVNFGARLANAALFAEEAINVTPAWLVTAGLRWEQLSVDRTVDDFNAATTLAFSRDYDAVSWRIGTVYDLALKTQWFAQYSSAIVPVGTLLLISQSSSRFALSKGEALETGVKSSFLQDRFDLTFSVFRIEQDDIVTRDPANSSLSIQGGSQSSQGVELSLSAALTNALRIDAGYSRIDAQYDELIEAGGADRAGKTPTNVPEAVAQVFAIYEADALPLTFSVGARHGGHFYSDNANTIRVAGHTVVDASVGYKLMGGDLTLRGRNLSDELYADWSGSSATQVNIGAPRSFDVTFVRRFN